MNNNKNNNKVYIAAISYALITGLSFLFTKIALGTTNPLDLLAHRFTASFLGIMIPVSLKWVKLDLNKERIKKVIPLAIFYPLMFFGFQAFGLQYASSSEAGILLAVIPVFTLILASYFLKEQTTLMQKLSIVLSVTGVIYITIKKGSTFEFNNIKGIILLLLSALSFAGYSIKARGLTKDFSTAELSFIMNAFGFLLFNIAAIGNHLIHGNMQSFFLPLKEASFIIAVLYLGILSSLVTSLLTNYVLSKIEASKMSVFSNLGTVISIIAGAVFLKEKIFYYHIIGSILIVSGVIGANFLDKDYKSKKG